MRRSHIDIVCSILKALEKKPLKPTPLMYKANLSHKLLQGYIDELKTAKLIRENGPYYVLTDQGILYLKEYDKFLKFSSTFGL